MPRIRVNPEGYGWDQYFRTQAGQGGHGGLAAFQGQNYQRGAGLGSLFRGLFRAILPAAKTISKTVGKQALMTGTEIASDMLAGKSLESAAKRRGRKGARVLVKKAKNKLKQQKGSGAFMRRTKRRSTKRRVGQTGGRRRVRRRRCTKRAGGQAGGGRRRKTTKRRKRTVKRRATKGRKRKTRKVGVRKRDLTDIFSL